MKDGYDKVAQPDKVGLRELQAGDGREHLLPLVSLFALAAVALDQIIEVIGCVRPGPVPAISAAEVAGQKQRGKNTPATRRATRG